MKVLAEKTQKKLLIYIYLAIGIILGIIGVVVIPILIFSIDPILIQEPLAWAIVVGIALFFALTGYITGVRPLILYKNTPDVIIETDGEKLYIHGKKEAVIPLKEMEGTYLDAFPPYMLTREFFVHLFSGLYGKVIIETPNHGNYKCHFVQDCRKVVQDIHSLIVENL